MVETKYFFLYSLPKYLVGRDKREYCATWVDIYFVGKQYLLFLGLTGILTNMGLFHLDWDSENPINSVVAVMGQYYAIALLKDNTSMRFLHPLMHTSWSHIHMEHHMAKKELRVLTTFHGDWIDLLLETAGGPIFYLLFAYMVGLNVSVHLISWFGIVWMDINSHSVNPHTVVFWFPPLDYALKATIAHSLHHIYPHSDKYMMFIPFRHLDRQLLDQDIQSYNNELGTSVNVLFWLPSR